MALSCLTCNLFQQQFNNKNFSLLSSWTLVILVVTFACATEGTATPPPPKVCYGEPFAPPSHAVGETNHGGKCICRHGGDWSLTQAGFDDNCDCAWNGMITCFSGFRKPQCKRFDGATSLTSTTSLTYYSAGDRAAFDNTCLCVKTDPVWGVWRCADDQPTANKKELAMNIQVDACVTNVNCDGTETEYCFSVDIGEAEPVQYQMSQCQLNRDVMCPNPTYSLVGFPSNAPCSSSSTSKKALPQTSCPAGKVYSECTSCIQTCDDLLSSMMCTSVCTAGCTCPSGFKDFKGACVQESLCPALVNSPARHRNTVTTHKSVEMKEQSLETNVRFGNQSQGGEKAASELFLQIALVVSGGVCCALVAVIVLLVAKNNKRDDLLLTSNNQVPATGAMNV